MQILLSDGSICECTVNSETNNVSIDHTSYTLLEVVELFRTGEWTLLNQDPQIQKLALDRILTKSTSGTSAETQGDSDANGGLQEPLIEKNKKKTQKPLLAFLFPFFYQKHYPFKSKRALAILQTAVVFGCSVGDMNLSDVDKKSLETFLSEASLYVPPSESGPKISDKKRAFIAEAVPDASFISGVFLYTALTFGLSQSHRQVGGFFNSTTPLNLLANNAVFFLFFSCLCYQWIGGMAAKAYENQAKSKYRKIHGDGVIPEVELIKIKSEAKKIKRENGFLFSIFVGCKVLFETLTVIGDRYAGRGLSRAFGADPAHVTSHWTTMVLSGFVSSFITVLFMAYPLIQKYKYLMAEKGRSYSTMDVLKSKDFWKKNGPDLSRFILFVFFFRLFSSNLFMPWGAIRGAHSHPLAGSFFYEATRIVGVLIMSFLVKYAAIKATKKMTSGSSSAVKEGSGVSGASAGPEDSPASTSLGGSSGGLSRASDAASSPVAATTQNAGNKAGLLKDVFQALYPPSLSVKSSLAKK